MTQKAEIEPRSTKKKSSEATIDAKNEWSRIMEGRWLSVDEIADYLGIKRDTVYKWIRERQMPGHKIGRLWKFDKKEVDDWVKSGGANENQPASTGVTNGKAAR